MMKKKAMIVLSTLILGSLMLSGCMSESTDVGTKVDKEKTTNVQENPVAGNNGVDENNAYANSPLKAFFHTYDTNVSGAAYVTEDNANNTATLHTSAGAQSGSITIKGDGTYVWNSTWEGRIIQGKWQETNDSDYPIVLLQGEDGRDWKVGKDQGTDIIVWDQNSISKNGHLVK